MLHIISIVQFFTFKGIQNNKRLFINFLYTLSFQLPIFTIINIKFSLYIYFHIIFSNRSSLNSKMADKYVASFINNFGFSSTQSSPNFLKTFLLLRISCPHHNIMPLHISCHRHKIMGGQFMSQHSLVFSPPPSSESKRSSQGGSIYDNKTMSPDTRVWVSQAGSRAIQDHHISKKKNLNLTRSWSSRARAQASFFST